VEDEKGCLGLGRYLGQSIMIGDDVEVRVTRIQHNQVILSVKAPKKVTVHRKEIWDRVQAERKDGVV
jgi:carbon storage regulator